MDLNTASAVSRYIEDRLHAYWHDVDFNWGENAAGHYTEDGLFEAPTVRYEGREQIAAFYRWRKTRGARVNVHLVGNFSCTLVSDTEAAIIWICTLYARDGEAPQPSEAATAISRVEDRFLLQDGEWLCAHRKWITLFRGERPTTRLAPEEMARLVDGEKE